MKGFEGKDEKEEMIQLYYNLKNIREICQVLCAHLEFQKQGNIFKTINKVIIGEILISFAF